MLKIVSAYEMNPSYVLDFYYSYSNKAEMQCFPIEDLEDSVDKYFKTMDDYSLKVYYLINDSNPQYILGYGTIFNSLAFDFHDERLNNGNLSYGIRPSERNRGYATELLGLLILKCGELHMSEVCISCLKDNLASRKIIEKNGGVFEREFNQPALGGSGLKYWIQIPKKQKEKVIDKGDSVCFY